MPARISGTCAHAVSETGSARSSVVENKTSHANKRFFFIWQFAALVAGVFQTFNLRVLQNQAGTFLHANGGVLKANATGVADGQAGLGRETDDFQHDVRDAAFRQADDESGAAFIHRGDMADEDVPKNGRGGGDGLWRVGGRNFWIITGQVDGHAHVGHGQVGVN